MHGLGRSSSGSLHQASSSAHKSSTGSLPTVAEEEPPSISSALQTGPAEGGHVKRSSNSVNQKRPFVHNFVCSQFWLSVRSCTTFVNTHLVNKPRFPRRFSSLFDNFPAGRTSTEIVRKCQDTFVNRQIVLQ